MVYILYTFLSKEFYDTAFSDQLKTFPSEYSTRIKKFRRWQDQQASVFGRILLMHGLSKYYGIEIGTCDILINDDGKPYVNDHTVEFNISHSGELVVCAFSKTQTVGIDVEQMNDIQIEDFYWQMTGHEKVMVQNSKDPKHAFYKYWTQKEAVLKANGKGLSIPLKSFQIIESQTQLQSTKWLVTQLDIHPAYSAHIATQQSTDYNIQSLDHTEMDSIVRSR